MKCIKIDYKSGDGSETFELFNDIEKAFKFVEDHFGKIKPFEDLKVSLVHANDNNLYFEEDGALNYEDNSNLFYYEEKEKYTDFLDDKEKMRDFKKLTKEEFLKSYSYLTEEEYNLTLEALK